MDLDNAPVGGGNGQLPQFLRDKIGALPRQSGIVWQGQEPIAPENVGVRPSIVPCSGSMPFPGFIETHPGPRFPDAPVGNPLSSLSRRVLRPGAIIGDVLPEIRVPGEMSLLVARGQPK